MTNKDNSISKINETHIPTGYRILDEVIGGGLTAGLHCIGGAPSIGKSALCLQMASNISDSGVPVLYAALGTQCDGMLVKLISEETARPKPEMMPLTIDEIVSVYNYIDKSDYNLIETSRAADVVYERCRLLKLMTSYAWYENVNKIAKCIEDFISSNEQLPVLFVDCLQELDTTDTQSCEYNVAQLKSIATRFNIPVVVVSSLTCVAKDGMVLRESFADSGNILTMADTLLGMQYSLAGTNGFNEEDAKSQCPRDIMIVVLKQRYGKIGRRIRYLFRPEYSQICEMTEMTPEKYEQSIVRFFLS